MLLHRGSSSQDGFVHWLEGLGSRIGAGVQDLGMRVGVWQLGFYFFVRVRGQGFWVRIRQSNPTP